jgi:hypothetical protein
MFYDERVDSLGGRVVESTLIERVVFPILETRRDVRQASPLSVVAAIFPRKRVRTGAIAEYNPPLAAPP